MRMRKDLLIGVMALTCFAGAAQANSMHKSTSSERQTGVSSHETTGQSTSSSTQINLTPQQKQQIFNAAQSLPQEQGQSASLSTGSKVPSNMTLHPLPQQAKQTLGTTLQNAEIAKLQNGDVIVVNPSDKTVQAVITAQDASSTTGSAGSMNSPSSRK